MKLGQYILYCCQLSLAWTYKSRINANPLHPGNGNAAQSKKRLVIPRPRTLLGIQRPGILNSHLPRRLVPGSPARRISLRKPDGSFYGYHEEAPLQRKIERPAPVLPLPLSYTHPKRVDIGEFRPEHTIKDPRLSAAAHGPLPTDAQQARAINAARQPYATGAGLEGDEGASRTDSITRSAYQTQKPNIRGNGAKNVAQPVGDSDVVDKAHDLSRGSILPSSGGSSMMKHFFHGLRGEPVDTSEEVTAQAKPKLLITHRVPITVPYDPNRLAQRPFDLEATPYVTPLTQPMHGIHSYRHDYYTLSQFPVLPKEEVSNVEDIPKVGGIEKLKIRIKPFPKEDEEEDKSHTKPSEKEDSTKQQAPKEVASVEPTEKEEEKPPVGLPPKPATVPLSPSQNFPGALVEAKKEADKAEAKDEEKDIGKPVEEVKETEGPKVPQMPQNPKQKEPEKQPPEKTGEEKTKQKWPKMPHEGLKEQKNGPPKKQPVETEKEVPEKEVPEKEVPEKEVPEKEVPEKVLPEKVPPEKEIPEKEPPPPKPSPPEPPPPITPEPPPPEDKEPIKQLPPAPPAPSPSPAPSCAPTTQPCPSPAESCPPNKPATPTIPENINQEPTPIKVLTTCAPEEQEASEPTKTRPTTGELSGTPPLMPPEAQADGNPEFDKMSRAVYQVLDEMAFEGGSHMVEIKSSGCDDPPANGNACEESIGSIKFDGEELSKGVLGFNLVVMSYPDLVVKYTVGYQTGLVAEDSQRMARFLMDLKGDNVIFLASKGDSSASAGQEVYDALTLFGLRSPFMRVPRSSLAFVGCRGDCSGPWVQQVQRKPKEGPSVISLVIGPQDEFVSVGGGGSRMFEITKHRPKGAKDMDSGYNAGENLSNDQEPSVQQQQQQQQQAEQQQQTAKEAEEQQQSAQQPVAQPVPPKKPAPPPQEQKQPEPEPPAPQEPEPAPTEQPQPQPKPPPKTPAPKKEPPEEKQATELPVTEAPPPETSPPETSQTETTQTTQTTQTEPPQTEPSQTEPPQTEPPQTEPPETEPPPKQTATTTQEQPKEPSAPKTSKTQESAQPQQPAQEPPETQEQQQSETAKVSEEKLEAQESKVQTQEQSQAQPATEQEQTQGQEESTHQPPSPEPEPPEKTPQTTATSTATQRPSETSDESSPVSPVKDGGAAQLTHSVTVQETATKEGQKVQVEEMIRAKGKPQVVNNPPNLGQHEDEAEGVPQEATEHIFPANAITGKAAKDPPPPSDVQEKQETSPVQSPPLAQGEVNQQVPAAQAKSHHGGGNPLLYENFNQKMYPLPGSDHVPALPLSEAGYMAGESTVQPREEPPKLRFPQHIVGPMAYANPRTSPQMVLYPENQRNAQVLSTGNIFPGKYQASGGPVPNFQAMSTPGKASADTELKRIMDLKGDKEEGPPVDLAKNVAEPLTKYQPQTSAFLEPQVDDMGTEAEADNEPLADNIVNSSPLADLAERAQLHKDTKSVGREETTKGKESGHVKDTIRNDIHALKYPSKKPLKEKTEALLKFFRPDASNRPIVVSHQDIEAAVREEDSFSDPAPGAPLPIKNPQPPDKPLKALQNEDPAEITKVRKPYMGGQSLKPKKEGQVTEKGKEKASGPLFEISKTANSGKDKKKEDEDVAPESDKKIKPAKEKEPSGIKGAKEEVAAVEESPKEDRTAMNNNKGTEDVASANAQPEQNGQALQGEQAGATGGQQGVDTKPQAGEGPGSMLSSGMDSKMGQEAGNVNGNFQGHNNDNMNSNQNGMNNAQAEGGFKEGMKQPSEAGAGFMPSDESAASFAQQQGESAGMQGQTGNVQGQADNLQGQTGNVQGQADNLQGQTGNVQGQADNLQGQIGGETAAGSQAMPAEGEAAINEDKKKEGSEDFSNKLSEENPQGYSNNTQPDETSFDNKQQGEGNAGGGEGGSKEGGNKDSGDKGGGKGYKWKGVGSSMTFSNNQKGSQSADGKKLSLGTKYKGNEGGGMNHRFPFESGPGNQFVNKLHPHHLRKAFLKREQANLDRLQKIMEGIEMLQKIDPVEATAQYKESESAAPKKQYPKVKVKGQKLLDADGCPHGSIYKRDSLKGTKKGKGGGKHLSKKDCMPIPHVARGRAGPSTVPYSSDNKESFTSVKLQHEYQGLPGEQTGASPSAVSFYFGNNDRDKKEGEMLLKTKDNVFADKNSNVYDLTLGDPPDNRSLWQPLTSLPPVDLKALFITLRDNGDYLRAAETMLQTDYRMAYKEAKAAFDKSTREVQKRLGDPGRVGVAYNKRHLPKKKGKKTPLLDISTERYRRVMPLKKKAKVAKKPEHKHPPPGQNWIRR